MKGYNPYIRGRWYRFFIESDGSDYTLTENDIEGASISGTRIKMPTGFHVMDLVYDIHSVSGGTASGVQFATYIYADGSQALNLPGKDQFDSAYIYVFGKYED